jgi:hypothetical protein
MLEVRPQSHQSQGYRDQGRRLRHRRTVRPVDIESSAGRQRSEHSSGPRMVPLCTVLKWTHDSVAQCDP